MAARVFSVTDGSGDYEIECVRHGRFVTQDPARAEQIARLHDYCRARDDIAAHKASSRVENREI